MPNGPALHQATIKDAFEFLSQVHGQLAEEATRYRNYEWKITGYVIAVFIWFVSVIVLDPTKSPRIFWVPHSKCGLIAILVLIALFHSYAVLYTHIRLHQTRNKQNQLERLFARYFVGDEINRGDLAASLNMARPSFRFADLNFFRRDGLGSGFVCAFIGFVWIVFVFSLIAISHAVVS